MRAEILAGFVNGLFLLFIAFFIFSEAVEVRCYSKPANMLYMIYIYIIINIHVMYAIHWIKNCMKDAEEQMVSIDEKFQKMTRGI